MNFRRIILEDNMDNLPEVIKEFSELKESIKEDKAEFYLIDDKYEFWFFKEDEHIELCVNEKKKNSLFDDKFIMEEIFKFLKEKGYKKARLSLHKNLYTERQQLAIEYGFKQTSEFGFGDFHKYIMYEKYL